jgi:hypothetical protein
MAGQAGLGVLSQDMEMGDAMGRFLYLTVLTALLAGCVPIAADPARDEFGVSTARPDGGAAAAGDTEIAKLGWKAGQVCDHGYEQTRQDIEPAEANQQIVDMKLRCGHYDRLNFDYSHTNWLNLF